MAHYLLRAGKSITWQIVESESAVKAVAEYNPEEEDMVSVWTLRSGEPRVYQVTTESVRTVKLVDTK